MNDQSGYRVTATWKSEREGVVSAEGILPTIPFCSPTEFKGEICSWTPEHFLVAAVASCYLVTFHAIAELSKMEFLGLTLFVEGKLGKPEGKLRFTEIVLRPTLTIIQNQDRERANRLLENAEQECLIIRSLKCPVVMEPLVQNAEEIMAR